MKRLPVLMILAAILLVAGCTVDTYTDPGQTVTIGVNQQFVIALGSNPGSTGYSWQESHNQTMIELVEKTYKEEAKEGVVGAGGVEYFRFKAVETGQTEITLVYQRPWEEEEILDQKIFTVDIK